MVVVFTVKVMSYLMVGLFDDLLGHLFELILVILCSWAALFALI